MSVSLSPIFNGWQGFSIGGLPLAGGLLNTYLAGTSTPAGTYTDSAGLILNANPIQMDGAGLPPNEIWLTDSVAYKFVLTDALGLSPRTYDNVKGVDPGGSAAALAAALAAAGGPSLVGFNPTTNYVAATIGEAVQDGLVNVMWFLSATQRAQVQANGTTLDLTTAISAAKTWGGNRPLYMPAGTWSYSSLSFIGNLGGIVGDGIGVTILHVNSAVTNALNFNETADANPRAGTLRGFTLDCNSLATNGINIRYRHLMALEDIYVINATGTGLLEKDSYLVAHRNVTTAACAIGHWLVGSNHASTYVGGGSNGNSVQQLLVQTNGTAADGNSGLAFIGWQYEFGTGASTGADITCTDLTFEASYIGENIPGAVLINRGGIVRVNGGTMFFGSTGTSYLVQPLGGKVLIKGTVVNGQASGSASNVSNGTGGTVKFEDIQFNAPVSGSPVIVGDVLDYGPPAVVFAPRLGKGWTGEGNNVTFSSAVSGNKQTFTVLTAPGPTPLLGAKANLVAPSTWRDGELLYLVLVYESSKTVNVSLSGSGFGGAPVKSVQPTLPATTGTPNTAIGFQQTADSAAYVLLEVIQTSSAVADTLVIYECFLADSRMLNKGAGQFGNLYKC